MPDITSVHVCIHARQCTYVCMYVCLYMYVFMYVCVCMYQRGSTFMTLHIQDAYACRNTDAVIPSLIKFILVGVCSEAERMSGKMKRISKFVNLCILISE